MKVTVIGKEIQAGSFVDKDTKQQVSYDNTIIYGIYKGEHIEGTGCKALKCPTHMVVSAGVDVGDVVVADIDRKYDKVYALDVVKKGGKE